MENDKTLRILNGEKIYPYMDGKVIRLSYFYDLRECYKEILSNERVIKLLDENNYKRIDSYKEFNRLLFEDKKFLNIIKTYFPTNRVLISDKDGQYIYGALLIDEEDHEYNLRLVELYGDLNKCCFFDDYVDLFGNEITFK